MPVRLHSSTNPSYIHVINLNSQLKCVLNHAPRPIQKGKHVIGCTSLGYLGNPKEYSIPPVSAKKWHGYCWVYCLPSSYLFLSFFSPLFLSWVRSFFLPFCLSLNQKQCVTELLVTTFWQSCVGNSPRLRLNRNSQKAKRHKSNIELLWIAICLGF